MVSSGILTSIRNSLRQEKRGYAMVSSGIPTPIQNTLQQEK